MENEKVLYAKMFGVFSLTYGGNTLKLDMSSTTKMMQLLTLLLYYPEGISRDKLLRYLYGDSDLVDSKNNLRVTVYRLRKALVKAGLPEDDFVVIKNGIYRWGASVPVVCDVRQFQETVRRADEAQQLGDREQALAYWQEAAQLYTDEFLTLLALEEWVATESVQLKKSYFDCLFAACEELKRRREYNSMLQLCRTAAVIYPYDEWQMLEIDALIAMNRYNEAMEVYNETTAQLFEDLGLPPTENMLKRYRAMSNELEYDTRTADEIVEGLSEPEEVPGAYYVSYPSFVDNYRMLQRISERSGETNFLVVVTLVEKNGKPLDSPEQAKSYAPIMKTTLQRSLRRTDTFTKYSASQYLLLLVGLDQESVSIVTHRIDKYLLDNSGSRRVTCRYRGIPVARNMEPTAAAGWNFS